MNPRFVSASALAYAFAACIIIIAAVACAGSDDRTVRDPSRTSTTTSARTTRTTSVTVDKPAEPMVEPSPGPTTPPPATITPAPPPPPSEPEAFTPAPPPPDPTKLTAEVRRELAHDSRLSALARGVQVTAVGGKVTLRGTVKNWDERNLVEKHAVNTAGVTTVNNELVVKE